MRETEQPAQDEAHEEQDDAVIGLVFRRSLWVFAALAALVILILWWRNRPPTAERIIERDAIQAPAKLSQEAAQRPPVRFENITAAAGIEFVHDNGATGRKLLPETMGGGCAFLDYDNDGDQDLVLLNSDHWPDRDADAAPSSIFLYENDGTGSFQLVSEQLGLKRGLYGMGVACGDYDNDGRVDLFFSAYGANALFRNTGNGFEEVTQRAGVAGGERMWSTGAGFFDYDNDGNLDLFVANYVVWSEELDLKLNFTLNGKDRAYGPPKLYGGTFCYLYRNNGDGSFADVSAESGIQITNPDTGRPMGKALGVTFADIGKDGLIDVFVANDTVQNFLFRNLGNGSFEEVGTLSGVAYDNMGAATGAMGVDIADYGNGDYLGLSIANFANESSSLYVQQPRDPWQFADMSNSEGIGSPSRLKLSFGLFFFDYDLDGRQDLLQANGHLENEIQQIQPSQQYRQAAQLFWNRGGGDQSMFVAVPEDESGDLSQPIVGRGAAYADLDGDGDLDLLLTQSDGPPMLLANRQDLGHNWLRVKLEGVKANRDAIGTWIELTAAGKTLRRQVMPTRSYLSQVELPVTFGLGEHTQIEALRVIWPDGRVQEVPPPPVNTAVTIKQRQTTPPN